MCRNFDYFKDSLLNTLFSGQCRGLCNSATSTSHNFYTLARYMHLTTCEVMRWLRELSVVSFINHAYFASIDAANYLQFFPVKEKVQRCTEKNTVREFHRSKSMSRWTRLSNVTKFVLVAEIGCCSKTSDTRSLKKKNNITRKRNVFLENRYALMGIILGCARKCARNKVID